MLIHFLATSPAPVNINGLSSWTTILGAGILTLINTAISGIIGWWMTRPKRKADLFNAFMSESSDFREELRKERQLLKKELEETGEKLDTALKNLEETQIKESDCQELVKGLQVDLDDARKQITRLTQKVGENRL